MLLLDGVRRALYVRITALAGLLVAVATAHFRSGIGGDCSHGCVARAAAFRSAVCGVARTAVVRVVAAPGRWAAVSGVQRFLAAVSCEIRLVAWLGLVSGPSRRCAKESGFFDPLRPGLKRRITGFLSRPYRIHGFTDVSKAKFMRLR